MYDAHGGVVEVRPLPLVVWAGNWYVLVNYWHVSACFCGANAGRIGIVGLAIYLIFFIGVALAWFKAYNMTAGDPVMRSVISVFGAIVAFQWIISFKQGGISGGHGRMLMGLCVMRFAWVYARNKMREHRKMSIAWKASQVPRARFST